MSRAAPHRPPDPDGDKQRAINFAARAAKRVAVAETTRNNAIRFAADSGASLREIASATGLDHMTVKRVVDRLRATSD